MELDSLKGMSNAEVKYKLKDCAWREVTKMWTKELEDWPKLCVLEELVSGHGGFEAGREARTLPPLPPAHVGQG